MRSTRLLVAAAIAVGSLAAAAQASAAAQAGQAATARVPVFGHVFVLVGENKSLDQITPAKAPYIYKLKRSGAWFTHYRGVAWGSLANYVALTSGQYAPCQTTGPCGKKAVPSIFSQLGNGHWRDWNESMPRNCFDGYAGSTKTFNGYKPGHNPALYYANLPCAKYDVPAGTTGRNDMSAFNRAVAAGRVPAFNFVSPNLCEDSYHRCGRGNIVTQFDNFLAREVPLIEKSPAFGPRAVIFVTYDEGHVLARTPNTMMLVIGPQVAARTYSGRYDHYSTAATIERGLGLRCLAHACTASTLPAFG